MIVDMTRGRDILARASFGAALVCITLLMAGCVKPVERDDTRMSASPEQVRTAPTQPAVRPQEAAVEKKRKPTATAKQPVEDPASANPPVETSLETAAASPAADQPVYAATELMGKKPAEVTALMGAPMRVEQRAASTVWIYQDGDCGLDVFFFLDVATSDERVLTVAPTAESEAAAANAASAAAAAEPVASDSTASTSVAIAPAAGETPPPSTTTQSSAAGVPAAGAEPDAAPPANPAPAGDVVDVCYGKLRRS